ncbi:hypothetical protein DESC_660031 [Desulfosarcina cetonica]|nr:hypothetical protein DESC_660031 [Desulfosarcina cetonica]
MGSRYGIGKWAKPTDHRQRPYFFTFNLHATA